MRKKDLIILGCIGIVLLFLSKSVMDSYRGVMREEEAGAEKAAEEEANADISAGDLQELSGREAPEGPGIAWDDSSVAGEDMNVSLGELNAMPCYYFAPPEDMDGHVERRAGKLFGDTGGLERDIRETDGDGWGNYYKYTCSSEEGDFRLSGDSMDMTFMRDGMAAGGTDEGAEYDRVMEIQQIIDELRLGLYDREGKSLLTISEVHKDRFDCGYLINGIEASKYPYGECRAGGDISCYGTLQPIEFHFKHNRVSAIYHMVSDRYEREETVKNSYRGWDEILQNFREDIERGYRQQYKKDYGNRYISLTVTGMKCVYLCGYVNGKNARRAAVPAVEIYTAEDVYSFGDGRWARDRRCHALILKTKEIKSQSMDAWETP